jgi:hypothetical protein
LEFRALVARMPVRSSKGKTSKGDTASDAGGVTAPDPETSIVQHAPRGMMPHMMPQNVQQMVQLLNLVSAASRGGDLLSSVGALLGGQSAPPLRITMNDAMAPRGEAASSAGGDSHPREDDDADGDADDDSDDDEAHKQPVIMKKPSAPHVGTYCADTATAFLEKIGQGTNKVGVPAAKGTVTTAATGKAIGKPKAESKPKAKGTPKAMGKPKGKAKAKCTPIAKGKPNAKGKAKAKAAAKVVAKAKVKAKAAAKVVAKKKGGTLGCSKCRYLQNGCSACRY